MGCIHDLLRDTAVCAACAPSMTGTCTADIGTCDWKATSGALCGHRKEQHRPSSNPWGGEVSCYGCEAQVGWPPRRDGGDSFHHYVPRLCEAAMHVQPCNSVQPCRMLFVGHVVCERGHVQEEVR